MQPTSILVNKIKKEICIFEQYGTHCNFAWSVHKENIEIVNYSFSYSGEIFHYTGNMTNVVKYQITKDISCCVGAIKYILFINYF